MLQYEYESTTPSLNHESHYKNMGIFQNKKKCKKSKIAIIYLTPSPY